MKDLKVIESGLVPVYEDKNARTVVNARALYEFLGSERQFANWIRDRIEKYGFVDGEDYASFNEIVKRESGGGTTRTEYLLTIDTGKELAMVENNEKGRQVRKYFIECEKRAKGMANATASRDEIALKRADAMLNNSRIRIAKFIRETVKDIWEYLSPEARQAYSAHVVETVAGQPGLIPLPVVEKTWTASELGQEFGVSANKIGRIANANGLKTAEFGIEVLDKAKGHDKQVPSFRYNRKGKDQLEILLRGIGTDTVQ
jgi:phage anti-repressor protein